MLGRRAAKATYHAVTPLFLGLIQIAVCFRDYRLAIELIAKGTNAKTRGHQPNRLHRPTSDRAAHALGNAQSTKQIGFRTYEQELFSAPTPQMITCPHLSASTPRNGGQHNIANRMAIGVVNRLEMIDIKHHDRERFAITQTSIEFVFKHFQRLATVIQAG